MATSGRNRSAGGPGVLLVAATGIAAAAVALDAGFDLPAPLRALLFAGWAAAVGVLGWGTLGRRGRRAGEAVAAGGVAVVAFGLVVLCVPGGTRAGRLAPPWAGEPPSARLTVTTGDPVVARGAGVTLACTTDRRATGPAAVRLEVRPADGSGRPEPRPGLPRVPKSCPGCSPPDCRPSPTRWNTGSPSARRPPPGTG